MSAVYPSARDAALSGGLDVTTDTLKIQPVDSSYVYDDAHVALSDVSGLVAAPVTLTGLSVTGGVVAADPATFAAVAEDTEVAGLVVWVDGGSNPLVCHISRRTDTVPIDVTGNGGDITVTFDQGVFKL